MPRYIPCSNFPYCDRPADKEGEPCDDCKRKQERAKANRWRWAGWSKSDERKKRSNYKPK